MCQQIRSGQADAVQGGVVPAPYLCRPWLSGIYADALAIVTARAGEATEGLIGANMAFGRHVLGSVPQFETELGAGASGLGEDSLFAAQLVRAGLRIRFAEGGCVEHHFGEERLSSAYFLRWATVFGFCSALIDVRWLGRAPRHPRLMWAWWSLKLFARQALNRRPSHVPPEWALWYRWHVSYARACTRLASGR